MPQLRPDPGRLGFLHWVADSPSGGNRYDAELLAGLRRGGVSVTSSPLRGPLDPEHRPGLADELAAALEAERHWLLDGIVAVQIPELIGSVVASGRTMTVLVHHFGADAPELSAGRRTALTAREGAVLRAASGVLCTSHWAAAEVRRRYGVGSVGVAPPGVEPAALAPGSRRTGTAEPRILCVGTLSPSKDQLRLVSALAELDTLPWTARLVGAGADDYPSLVEAAIGAAGLTGRVQLSGALQPGELEAEWAAADLLVHPSRAEAYGMVVTEALAHGIPAVVTAGTGAVEALAAGETGSPPGTIVAAEDPGELVTVLRSWLSDDDLADRWRAAAVARRTRLPTWSQTALAAADYLAAVIGRTDMITG